MASPWPTLAARGWGNQCGEDWGLSDWLVTEAVMLLTGKNCYAISGWRYTAAACSSFARLRFGCAHATVSRPCCFVCVFLFCAAGWCADCFYYDGYGCYV